jgi:hypothetical protein
VSIILAKLRPKREKVKLNTLSNLTRTTLSGEIIEINKITLDKSYKTANAVCPCEEQGKGHDGEYCTECDHFHTLSFGAQYYEM